MASPFRLSLLSLGMNVPRPFISPNSFSHTSGLSDGIEILSAPGKGLGAFTVGSVASGAVVGEYLGEFLTRNEVEARYWGLKRRNKHDRRWSKSRKKRNQGVSGDYLFDMGSNHFVDGEDADISSWCRFANHADPKDCGCNVETRARRSYSDPSSPRIFFVALRDIAAGEEICYDYGEEYWGNDSFVSSGPTN